jgi:hypothetical protein
MNSGACFWEVYMFSLSDLPECVDDFIVSDLDLGRVNRYIVPERMIAYAVSAVSTIESAFCELCPCYNTIEA